MNWKSTFIAVLALWTYVACLGAAGDPLAKGNAYYNGRDFRGAIAQYKLAVAQNPHSYRAYYMMANSYYLLGEKERALDAYRNVVRIKPDEDEIQTFIKRLTEEIGLVEVEAGLAGGIDSPAPDASPIPDDPTAGVVSSEAAPPPGGLPDLPPDGGGLSLPDLPPESSGNEAALPDLPPEEESPIVAPALPSVDADVTAAPALPGEGGGGAPASGGGSEPGLMDLESMLLPEDNGAEDATPDAGNSLGWQEKEVIKKSKEEDAAPELMSEDGLPMLPEGETGQDGGEDLALEELLGEIDGGGVPPPLPETEPGEVSAPELPPELPPETPGAESDKELDIDELLDSLE